ncbi:MAG TPA: alpha/beta hydrolase [archaeon]|nr:alpha/beta hydrolase [archaeon]
MKRAVIIHGWRGYPKEGWFPWLKLRLEELGFDISVPAMPKAMKVREWVAAISKAAAKPDDDTYFIGHSLGCISILRYLETLPAGSKAGGCVFVAGFSNNTNVPEISEFYSLPLGIKKARLHAGNVTVILSDNDDVVPLAAGKAFAIKLGAKVVIVEKGMGHFAGSDGITELPSALEAVISRSPNIRD